MRHGVAIGVAVASSKPMASRLARGQNQPVTPGNVSVSTGLLSRSSPRQRVQAADVEQLRGALGERDWAVLRDVTRLRLASGNQLERLHFTGLSEASGGVVRRRVLGRLVQTRALATLPRRIGGVRAGSAGLVYHLDVAGQRLVSPDGRARRLDPPGERYMRHVLAVSELYVNLVERARQNAGTQLDQFETEPRWSDGRHSLLKPDAYAVVADEAHRDYWWVEVDLATEHLPTIKRKLATYVDFYRNGYLGPVQVMPWVLVTVPDSERFSQIVRLIHQLPHRADELFTVAVHNDAADVIMRRLSQP